MILYLLIGLLIGYWAKDIYVKVSELYEVKHEEREANKTGVVKAVGVRATKSQPIDLSTDTGGIMRPSPDQIALEHIKERDRVLKENHS